MSLFLFVYTFCNGSLSSKSSSINGKQVHFDLDTARHAPLLHTSDHRRVSKVIPRVKALVETFKARFAIVTCGCDKSLIALI